MASVPEYSIHLLWAFSVQTTSMALKLPHTDTLEPTLQRHDQLNTKSRATAFENHVKFSE